MKEKIRRHIIFYGRVQGVGFRYYSVNKARQLDLTGWVRNLRDGTVEMEVQGREEDIDQLILFLEKRTYIYIENIETKTLPLREEQDFYEKSTIY
ncbi:MAG: acylphosphatase [Blautia sp.]|nr:acylphosphatase [Blautia sp.]